MYTLADWQSALIDSWNQVWTSFLTILPSILGAIIIFTVGMIIAVWVRRLTVQFLSVVRFDQLGKRAGVDKYLEKADIKLTLAELIGLIFQWLIILVFFLAAVDILGLEVVSEVLTRFISYIPNIIAAALIFAAGFIVAGVVDGLVRGALVSVDHTIARQIGKVTRWLIILIAFFAAIDQMQIAQTLVAVFYQGLTYTIVLAVGLSVGLGGKDLVSRILQDWYEKFHK